jgi:intracellular septation protein A
MNQKLPLPEAFYKILEWHMCLFLIGFSTFMAFVALRESTATWLFWKTAGFYIAFGGFMILELLYLRFFVKGSVK